MFISIIGLITITGCSKIKDVAINNIITENQLPQFNLNTTSYEEIIYEDKIYEITNEVIDIELVKESIGKVNYICTLDENRREISKDQLRKIDIDGAEGNNKRYHLKFGWVHEIEGVNTDDEIAVNINHLYYRCKIEKV